MWNDNLLSALFLILFPRGFAQKVQFLGVGLLKRLNLHNCVVHLNAVSDLDSQDAWLSKTGHVFEVQPAVQES